MSDYQMCQIMPLNGVGFNGKWCKTCGNLGCSMRKEPLKESLTKLEFCSSCGKELENPNYPFCRICDRKMISLWQVANWQPPIYSVRISKKVISFIKYLKKGDFFNLDLKTNIINFSILTVIAWSVLMWGLNGYDSVFQHLVHYSTIMTYGLSYFILSKYIEKKTNISNIQNILYTTLATLINISIFENIWNSFNLYLSGDSLNHPI